MSYSERNYTKETQKALTISFDEGDFIDTDSEQPSTPEHLLDAPVDSTNSELPLVDQRLYDLMNRPYSNTYAYTLTLKPVYHSLTNGLQIKLFKQHLVEMTKISEGLYYFVAERTKIGNIHLHGVIDTSYETQRRKIDIHLRKLGFIESKPLFYAYGWFDYMTKESNNIVLSNI